MTRPDRSAKGRWFDRWERRIVATGGRYECDLDKRDWFPNGTTGYVSFNRGREAQWPTDPLSSLFHLLTNLYDLNGLIGAYGGWVYAVLFVFIFCETGLVVAPFLPGDSILFIAGTFAAAGSLDVRFLLILLAVAAVAGDSVNYSIGRFVGPRAFRENVRFLKKEYVNTSHVFFEKHGGKTIIIARFAPIIRTFVPFVAGVGGMRYGRFFSFNVIGGVAWIALLVGTGYFFGNIQFVKDNFTIIIYAIVAVSLLPVVYELVAHRKGRRKEG